MMFQKRKYQYAYPGTDVLVNNLDIMDESLLLSVERVASNQRIAELYASGKFTGKFDAKHLAKLHYYIFQDVYPWAGRFRDTYLAKGNTEFVDPKNILSCLNKIHSDIKHVHYMKGLSREEVVDFLTITLSNLNKIHPFREGNGRTQRIFLEQLALVGGYDLDFSNVTSNQMRDASVSAYRKNFKPMQIMINECLMDIDDF